MAKKKQTKKDDKEAAPTKTEIAIHCKYDKLVDPKKLKPHPANPWKHPDSQIDLLAKIMAKPDIGIRHEIIVSKTSGFIVEGHCRREAAIKLNIKEYPVVYQEFESEATERAVMLNDNKIAEFAEVDGLIMADNLVELDQLNYPLEFTAMTEAEIKQYVLGPIEVSEPTDIENEEGILARLRIYCPAEAVSNLKADIQEILDRYDGARFI